MPMDNKLDKESVEMGRYRDEISVPAHENRIEQFLYDEGPHESSDIANYVGLSASRVTDILGLMKDAGRVAIIRRGNPVKTYWLLAKDA